MAWFKSNWRVSTLHLGAVLVTMLVLTQGSTDWSDTDTFDPMLASGKWAIRFLLGCLAMTPLNTYFGWREAVKLRKPAGLWSFAFALLHLLLYIRNAKLEWLRVDMPFYLVLGLVGIGILTALAATSNRWAMQRLGKNWKRLHRLVYLAGMAIVTHGILATMMSKKVMARDPEAPNEIKIYIVILSALLVVRIPLVRQWLIQILNWLKQWRVKVQSSRVSTPDREVEWYPRIHGRESSVSVKPTFVISNKTINYPERSTLNNTSERADLPSEGYHHNQSTEILAKVEGEIQETAP